MYDDDDDDDEYSGPFFCSNVINFGPKCIRKIPVSLSIYSASFITISVTVSPVKARQADNCTIHNCG